MKDVLAGKREAINASLRTSIFWPNPDDQKCPVEVGQAFRLRCGTIEITRVERVRRNGKPHWLAHFRRRGKPSRPSLLKFAGGYTDDPDRAMRAQDDPDAATLVGNWRENPRNLGPPPEPEGPPPDEVAILRKTMQDRLRHREQQREQRMEQNARADARRVSAHMRDVAVRAARLGLDATPFFAALEREIHAQERELRRAA